MTRDFKQVLADPLTFGAHYLLEDPQPVGVDTLDALNVAYPSLYKDGAGFAGPRVHVPSDGICSHYRLLRVVGHPRAIDQAAERSGVSLSLRDSPCMVFSQNAGLPSNCQTAFTAAMDIMTQSSGPPEPPTGTRPAG